VVTFDVWDESTHCLVAYKLDTGTTPVATELGRYGNVALNADGRTHVGGPAIDVRPSAGDRFDESYDG
jgi:hypothetical protein